MKKILIITDIILALAGVTMIIFAIYSQAGNHNHAMAPTVQQESPIVETSDEITPENQNVIMDVEQIKNNNFASIQGTWINSESSLRNRPIIISDDKVRNGGQIFNLKFAGTNENTGLPYLWMYLEGIVPEHGARFEIYPKGTHIPVKLDDNTIDYSGKYDPTNTDRDRIMMEGSAYTAQDILEVVLYRETEEAV